MIFRTILGFMLALLGCSCAEQVTKGIQQNTNGPNQHHESKSGLQIEFGPNLGTTHTDLKGNKHFYVHITATITNDSTIPIRLQSSLSNEHEFPSFCGDKNKYKVFLLPEELTPDTPTVYNNIVNGPHDFLNSPMDNNYTFNKTLQPREFCVVTIGVLSLKPSNCAAVPRAVFSHETNGLYQVCDRQVNPAISIDSPVEIGVKLEYYNQRKFIAPEDDCVVIPFGQVSYPER